MVRLQMNFRYSETCQIKMPNKEIKIHTYLSNHYNTMESSFPLYLWLWDKRIRRISSLQILNFLTKDALKCRSKNDGDIFGEFFIKQNYVSTVFKQANHSEEESKIPDLWVSFLDQESHHWSRFLTAIEQSRASQLTEMQLEEKNRHHGHGFSPSIWQVFSFIIIGLWYIYYE